jgi:general secretion pathway protein E
MAQRLMRTLCPKCKQPGGMRAEDEAAWNALVAPWKSTMPTQLYHPAGCLDCRMTGYKGRVGIYEIMPHVERDQETRGGRRRTGQAARQAMREGMKPCASPARRRWRPD